MVTIQSCSYRFMVQNGNLFVSYYIARQKTCVCTHQVLKMQCTFICNIQNANHRFIKEGVLVRPTHFCISTELPTTTAMHLNTKIVCLNSLRAEGQYNGR